MHADVHSSNQTNSLRQMSQTLIHVPNHTHAINSIKLNTLNPSDAMQIEEIITPTSTPNSLNQPHYLLNNAETHLRAAKKEVQANSNLKEPSSCTHRKSSTVSSPAAKHTCDLCSNPPPSESPPNFLDRIRFNGHGVSLQLNINGQENFIVIQNP